MAPLRGSRSQAGMTMVELLVGLGIFAVVTLTLTLVLFSTTRLGSRTSQRAGVQGTVRQAMSLMTTELRQAGADPSIPPAGILGIVAADSQTVRIRADHSGDGILQTTEPSEDVTYSYTQGTGALTRDPGTGAVTVASNITSLLFRYFDAANTPLTTLPLSAADAALVKTIRVTLTAEDGESRPITLDTRITLRNR